MIFDDLNKIGLNNYYIIPVQSRLFYFEHPLKNCLNFSSKQINYPKMTGNDGI